MRKTRSRKILARMGFFGWRMRGNLGPRIDSNVLAAHNSPMDGHVAFLKLLQRNPQAIKQ